NDDDGVVAVEHAEPSTHHHDGEQHGGSAKQAEACCNVHKPAPNPRPRALRNGLIGTVIALKGRLPGEPSRRRDTGFGPKKCPKSIKTRPRRCRLSRLGHKGEIALHLAEPSGVFRPDRPSRRAAPVTPAGKRPTIANLK